MSKSSPNSNHRSKTGRPSSTNTGTDARKTPRDPHQPNPQSQPKPQSRTRAESDVGDDLSSNFTKWLPVAFGLSTIDADLPRRLRCLADDLQALRISRKPSDETLEAAPLLIFWRPIVRPHGLILAGVVTDHPTLRGPIITTSPIWAIAADLSWVRTTSRIYRLGTPAKVRGDNEEVRTDDL